MNETEQSGDFSRNDACIDGALMTQEKREKAADRIVNASRSELDKFLAEEMDDRVLGMAFVQASRKDDWQWRCPLISARRKVLESQTQG